jgi:DTW domain-containing protein YfiP
MHESLCICAMVPKLETRTRLVVLMHRAEKRKSTNTGALAAKCIANSEIMVRGVEDHPSAFVTGPETQPLLLFPHEDAVPLDRFAHADKPITLVVPDGTWRQASKVRARVSGLRDVPCVRLPLESESIYRLRAESHTDRLSTIEAIARAMGILEGMHVREALDHVFRAMVERTLWAKGVLDDHDVTGGIPRGVMRHDPKSGLSSS